MEQDVQSAQPQPDQEWDDVAAELDDSAIPEDIEEPLAEEDQPPDDPQERSWYGRTLKAQAEHRQFEDNLRRGLGQLGVTFDSGGNVIMPSTVQQLAGNPAIPVEPEPIEIDWNDPEKSIDAIVQRRTEQQISQVVRHFMPALEMSADVKMAEKFPDWQDIKADVVAAAQEFGVNLTANPAAAEKLVKAARWDRSAGNTNPSNPARTARTAAAAPMGGNATRTTTSRYVDPETQRIAKTLQMSADQVQALRDGPAQIKIGGKK